MKLTWNPPFIEPETALFSNSSDHAAQVHEFDDIPRPWMTTAIAEVDIEQVFKEMYNGNINQTFREVAEALHGNMLALILDDVWEWDGVTYRKNGEVVGSPRNIYDTGDIYEKQALDFE